MMVWQKKQHFSHKFVNIHLDIFIIFLSGAVIHPAAVAEYDLLLRIVDFQNLTVVEETGRNIFSCAKQYVIIRPCDRLEIYMKTIHASGAY